MTLLYAIKSVAIVFSTLSSYFQLKALHGKLIIQKSNLLKIQTGWGFGRKLIVKQLKFNMISQTLIQIFGTSGLKSGNKNTQKMKKNVAIEYWKCRNHLSKLVTDIFYFLEVSSSDIYGQNLVPVTFTS